MKPQDSLYWGKRKTQSVEAEDSGNSAADDESKRKNELHGVLQETVVRSLTIEELKDGMTENHLAAKALQLRLKGKHEEAKKLLSKSMSTKQGNQDEIICPRTKGSSSSKKSRKSDDHGKQILTQHERCLFCLDNPDRPMHLVISIANYTYLMLPKWKPVVPGHCCILPIQHESATRSVDEDVWIEVRNFKKCLIMMFAKQGKELIFLETVIGLAQQHRHCMIECIPLPKDIAKTAPLYFKKAIDEAEDEWSQHHAKKLIDTSEKGLRNSVPQHFPYFHVEFGLNKGYVHVIDDEKRVNSNFGLNVIRGMLHLAEEDMYQPHRYEAVDVQKQAVASFLKNWEPFDWTKQLHLG
ncbi:hypothetical protein K1719_029722 [Acacia pycnantha]|nr:hypothetical protein K1719_029722 [Acacia pycnantha]